MIGLGTLINTALVVAGGIAGMFFGRFITPRLQDGLMKATALSVLFVGLAGALGGMLSIADGQAGKRRHRHDRGVACRRRACGRVDQPGAPDWPLWRMAQI